MTISIVLDFLPRNLSAQQEANASAPGKGAIIIVSMKGEVTVTENRTKRPLPAVRTKVGAVLFDGHTVRTGKGGEVVLLLSNGTVSTLREETTLDLKKFTQVKFDPLPGKLSALEGEPSVSETVFDLKVGDLVVDVKKLDRRSSFDIDSPVGAAGIRGTRVRMNVRPAPGGGYVSNITVPEGQITYTPPAPPAAAPGALPPPPPEVVPVAAGQSVAPVVDAAGVIAAVPVPVAAAVADLTVINVDLDTAVACRSEILVVEVVKAIYEVTLLVPVTEPAQKDEAVPNSEPATEESAPAPQSSPPESSSPFPTDAVSSEQISNANPKTKAMREVPRRLLQMGLSLAAKETYSEYSEKTRRKLLELEDEALLNLLTKGWDEVTVSALLTNESLSLMKSGSHDFPSPESEPDEFVPPLEEWLSMVETANAMLADGDLAGSLPESMLFDGEQLLNPLFAEARSVFDATSTEAGLPDPEAVHSLYAGRRMALGPGIYAPPGESERDLYLLAAESLGLVGRIEFPLPADGRTRVVLMSGGTLEASAGTSQAASISTAVSDLVVTVRETVSLRDVSIESGANLYLESLSDLMLEGGFLSASDLISLRASRLLSVDSTRFSETLRDVRMRADTIDLRDVDFPSGANVNLQSLRGPIDGKYPTFRPDNRQYGRVNFLEGVRQGGKSLMDRSLFDANGGKVTIERIPRP